MAQEKDEDIFLLIQIGQELRQEEVQKLLNFLKVPSALCDDVTDGSTFLYILQRWGDHNSYAFYQGLLSIGRPDLIKIALKMPWLATNDPHARMEKWKSEELSMKTFVRLLKTEFNKKDWVHICLHDRNLDISMTFEDKMRILVQDGNITKDLTKLIRLMKLINRSDIAQILINYQRIFGDFSNDIFISSFDIVVYEFSKEMGKWENSLKNFIAIQSRSVKQLIDDEKTVELESVYVPLTIIKEKPKPIDLEDETSYNEISIMRKIAKREILIVPVDFRKELRLYDPTEPNIWCILGNPGSGKSFLCHRTALRFGQGELRQFSYSLSIPCRDQQWHQMEEENKGKAVDEEFIQKWLSISMSVGSSWTKDLAKHLVDSDGERLLLIIDGLDEFIKSVNFDRTLLFSILTRKTLFRATILMTSRPGAFSVISTAHTLLINRFYQVLGFSPINRNIYFTTQISSIHKLKQLKELLHLHDEINQLSLIPVNASLFSALVRGSENITAQTLTQLYSELVAYLIRRQLYRMNLKYLANKKSLFRLHPVVQDCLFRIGELAFLGIYKRELICNKDVLLKVDKIEKPCQCLGLAQEHIKKDHLGGITRVWSFVHLTMQEFVGAFWLYSCSWRDQFLSTRYIVNNNDTFLMFRMMLRFLSGLLSRNALHLLCIVYKYLTPSLIHMDDVPMIYQLAYAMFIRIFFII